MSVQIQLRRGLAADWSSANPILALGEIGIATDTSPPQFKTGDGVSNWNALPWGGLVGPRGLPGPQGPAGISSINVTAPLNFNQTTNTLSLDNPIDGIDISGGNF